jgi:hypothetical protein
LVEVTGGFGRDPDKPRKIGERYKGIDTDGAEDPDQPFVVLREATEEEWLAEQEPGAPLPPNRDLTRALFYEVSLD